VSGARRGFTLIEIMVAMTLFAVVATGLAGVMFQYLRAAVNASGGAAVTAAVTADVDYLTAVSYDSLASRAGCTAQSQPIAHQRCITVTSLGRGWKQIMLVETPSNAAIKPDTAVFQRSKAVAGPIR
jgi:prepilin-type N-terminal cleavage/methylation domain-containing protein